MARYNFLALADIRALGHEFILISELLVAGTFWPWTLLHPRCFCLVYHCFLSTYYCIAKCIIATNLKICVILYRKKSQEGTIKIHGVASHFVYVATIVLVYGYVSLFL